ncbi:NAD(P)/FAD-dependent oxidoreductase [Arthrobacter sp. ov118]|uniref:NAD(P)/FAD-dependent oxidoreductase n=1 Tax=Arthrobacter sp. ov118 TaxID=1761747 RepID=UPI0008E62D5D|nr:FAD-dependent oxidoreductase [Arthrobacter sp. ov118]SFT99169.1 NADH dehydrogenase, FAD-containing subunit [Arthrobacter sp. ov118]
MSARFRVVIIGAGYAGVMAANRLAGSKQLPESLTVTIVNPVADFLERIRLHEVAAGSRASAAVPMRSVLNQRADVIADSVLKIDPINRQVYFSSGRAPLSYDALLYSVGSTQAAKAPVGAYGLQDAESAGRLRARLSQLEEGARVSIIGGGLTSIELSAEIAERYPGLQVRLVSRGVIADTLSHSGRHAVRKRLSALGVEMMDNTDVQACDSSSVRTSGGDTLTSDCTIWAAGFGAPALARDSGLPTDAEGRLMVDESLSCPQYADIFGAGDAVRIPDSVAGHLRMSCAAALPLGAHAADSILARLQKQAPAPLSAGYVLKCISLGRKSGLIQTVTADDRPRSLVVRGRLGGLAKEQICRMTLGWIRGELRRSGSYKWAKGPLPTAAR